MREKVEERIPFPWSVKEPLLKETGGRCAHCGVELDRYTNLSVDHFIPLNKGGTNETQNLTVLCEKCNSEKSDMILLPRTWYPYLCESKKKIFTDRIRQYMQDTDYLAEDCLVPVDMFKIEAFVTTKRNIGNKRIKFLHMPVYIQGHRITKEEAFEWLMEYKRHLEYRDAVGTVSRPSGFNASCYMLKKGDIDIAMVNPWMIHEYSEDLKNYRNEIVVDWFFSPSLPKKDYLPEMLASMTTNMECYILDSLASSMDDASIVVMRTRCFVSDKNGMSAFDLRAKGKFENKIDDVICEFGSNERMPSRIRELFAFVIVGKQDACQKFKKNLHEEFPTGFMSIEDIVKMSNSLNKRFKERKDK